MRRRWPIVVVVLVVLFGGVLLVADRVAAGVAQERIAAKLGEHRPFTSAPDVTIHDFPFLTQAVGGRYAHISVTGRDASVATADGKTVSQIAFHADLRGVHVAASDALRGDVTQLPVDRIDGYVTVPYDQLSQLASEPVTITASGSDLVVTGSVRVPVLGTVRASGRGTLQVRGSSVQVKLKSASVDGHSIPPGLAQSVIDALTPHLRLPTLPYQLKVDRATPGDGGLRIVGHAEPPRARDDP